MNTRFLKSWDQIETSYEKDLLGYIGDFPPGVLEEELSFKELAELHQLVEAEWGFLRPLLDLIKSLRRQGYDRLLHAHRSLLSLGLATVDDYESWCRGHSVSIEASSADGKLRATYWISGTKKETIDISRAPTDLVVPWLERLLRADQE